MVGKLMLNNRSGRAVLVTEVKCWMGDRGPVVSLLTTFPDVILEWDEYREGWYDDDDTGEEDDIYVEVV